MLKLNLKEFIQSNQKIEEKHKQLSSISDLSVLSSCQPSKNNFACLFIFFREKIMFHPNHNSILQIAGDVPQEVRNTRYVRFSILTYFKNPATKIRRGESPALCGDNQSRPTLNPRLHIFVFSYRCVISLLCP